MLNDNIKLQINYFHIYSFSIIIVQLYRYKADYQTRCESGNKYNVKSEDSDIYIYIYLLYGVNLLFTCQQKYWNSIINH